MHQTRFDELARSRALPSRRGFLAAIGAAVLTALFGAEPPDAALAKSKKGKRGKKRGKKGKDQQPPTGSGRSGCSPACVGKTCGGDGCGGSCGDCPDGTICQPNGTCLTCRSLGETCGASAGGAICCNLPCGSGDTAPGSTQTCRRATCGSVDAVCNDDFDCCNGVCGGDKRCRLQAVFCAGKNSCATASNPCHVPGSAIECECFVTGDGQPFCADADPFGGGSAANCSGCAQGLTCVDPAGGQCIPDGNVMCAAACPNPR